MSDPDRKCQGIGFHPESECGANAHSDVHDCDHDCACFWCRVSRKEPFETIEEVHHL